MAAVMSPATAVGQRRADVAPRELLVPGALAVEDVAEALDEYMAVREHIGELADLLRVGDRLVEGHGEVVRAEYRDVGVAALEVGALVGVAV